MCETLFGTRRHDSPKCEISYVRYKWLCDGLFIGFIVAPDNQGQPWTSLFSQNSIKKFQDISGELKTVMK